MKKQMKYQEKYLGLSLMKKIIKNGSFQVDLSMILFI